MALFKKEKKIQNEINYDTKLERKIKKRKKIGIRHPKRNKSPEENSKYNENEKCKIREEKNKIVDNEDDFPKESDIKIEENDDVFEEKITYKSDFDTLKDEGEKQWAGQKKNKIISKDMKNKPVFLEDTGEKLGIVFDMIYNKEKKLTGYKIKDEKSESVMSFPFDQFDEDKEGLIFIQSWYINSLKTIERLEFKEKISPELTTLIEDDTIPNEELYDIFIKHDDQMVHYIDEAVSLKELLHQRLKVLEKQRHKLKDSLMDLTEKRLIKDIDRKEFSEHVANHRRKVNVLDVNIKKCKDLLKRLNDTSFGKLGRQMKDRKDNEKEYHYMSKSENIEDSTIIPAKEIENSYKQKYDDIKERFDQLLDEYNELKSAAEKLIAKEKL